MLDSLGRMCYLIVRTSQYAKSGGEIMRHWLRSLRENTHLTMKQVSEQLGMSESSYCAIENGERKKKLDLSLAASLSAIFNIPVSEIIAHETNHSKK